MKRQNIYYIKLQEKLATLDCGKNYVLKITTIKNNITSDEEVVIQKKDAEKSQGIYFLDQRNIQAQVKKLCYQKLL